MLSLSHLLLQVFQLLMDSLFRSFNDNVGMNNFSELSGCVFSWLEEQCKPQLLQELMLNILQQVFKCFYCVKLCYQSLPFNLLGFVTLCLKSSQYFVILISYPYKILKNWHNLILCRIEIYTFLTPQLRQSNSIEMKPTRS